MEYNIADRNDIVTSLYVNPLLPNNFIMSYLNNLLDYVADRCPRAVKYKMISTYQKGIEYIHKEEKGQEMYTNSYPSLIVTPQQLRLDERINSPRHSMNRMSENTMVSHYKPYVKLGNLAIYPVTNRFTFNFELTYLAESYLELTDVILHMNRAFNNRFIYMPKIGHGILYLPNKMIDYIDTEYGHELLLMNQDIAYTYTSTYNRTLYGIPWHINSHVKLVDYADGSNYMGESELPTYRVTFNFESFLQIPNHIVSTFDPSINIMSFNLDVQGSATKSNHLFNLGTLDLDAKEVVFFHTADFQKKFEFKVDSNKIPDYFVEFKAYKNHIKSGIISRLNASEFDFENNNSKYVFKFDGIDSKEYTITIIGRYE